MIGCVRVPLGVDFGAPGDEEGADGVGVAGGAGHALDDRAGFDGEHGGAEDIDFAIEHILVGGMPGLGSGHVAGDLNRGSPRSGRYQQRREGEGPR